MTAKKEMSLIEDQRGAVMLTGLFMAFCLVGALWYVIGISEAVIFRSRMQEAADSAAFTAAVVNAKGMNFISVCNIFMLIFVTVYLIAAVIQDAAIISCAACGIGCVGCCLACPAVVPLIKINHGVAKGVKLALNITSAVEVATAVGTPWIATARASKVGSQYTIRENRSSKEVDKDTKAVVWAFGEANIPGVGGGTAGPIPLGLPVEGKAYGELCAKLGSDFVGLLGGVIGDKKVGWPLEKLGDAIKKLAGIFVKARYCNDLSWGKYFDPALAWLKSQLGKVKDELETGKNQSEAKDENAKKKPGEQLELPLGTGKQRPEEAAQINPDAELDLPDDESKWHGWHPWFDPGFDKGWGDKGYLVTHASAGNGRQPHQIWAINRNPRYFDESEKKVSFGAHTRDRKWAEDSWQGGSFGYFAQAEFYFDCEEDWKGDDCNAGDNASFSVRWRARLRRVQAPSLTVIIQKFAYNKLADKVSGAIRDVVDSAIGKLVPGGDAFRQSGIGVVLIEYLAGEIGDKLIDPMLEHVQGKLDDLNELIMPTAIEGSYH